MSDYPLDMPVPEFRQAGHDVIEWIGDYLDGFRDLPVPLLQPIPPDQVAALNNDLAAAAVPRRNWQHGWGRRPAGRLSVGRQGHGWVRFSR